MILSIRVGPVCKCLKRGIARNYGPRGGALNVAGWDELLRIGVVV